MEFIDDLKIIWRFLSKYKREVYVVFVVAIFASIVEAAVPYIYGRIVDLIIAKEKISILLMILAIWLVLSFAKDWGHRYVRKEGGILGVRCAVDLIAELHGHVLRLGLNFHKTQKAGKLTSRYIRASDFIEVVIREVFFWFGSDLLTMMLVYLAIFYIEWKIALVLGLIIAINILVTVRNIGKISSLLIGVIESYEEGDGIMHDATANIQVVKTNDNEKYEDKKANDSLAESLRRFTFFSNTWSWLDFRQQTIISIGTVLIFGMVITLYRNGLITVGQIVMLVGYLGLIFNPLTRISIHLDQFNRSLRVIRRALKLLDEKTEFYEGKSATKLKEVKGEIEFKEVSFCYHENRFVLENVSFGAKQGQVIALVGESGVGKTTLVDLISRYIAPSYGKIFLDGIDVQKIDLRNLRRQIAIVPQEVSLFNDTIKNNVIYGKLDATDEEIQNAVKAANADEFINNFPDKIDQEVGERGIKLSTGQKQRIAIARAILKNPKILILDEATSALDSKSEMLVQEALKRLIKGRTTFVIAHRLSTIMHADKILVLDKGKIVESGRHSELIKKKGLYHKLFTLQSLGEAEEE